MKVWLLLPPEEPKIKDSFLMQTFFMDNIPVDEIIFHLRTYQKERQQRLDKMQILIKEKWQSIKERKVMNARILLSSAVLKRGIEQEVYYIKWCDETINFIEASKFIWEKNNENSFTDVEDDLLAYFGDLI